MNSNEKIFFLLFVFMIVEFGIILNILYGIDQKMKEDDDVESFRAKVWLNRTSNATLNGFYTDGPWLHFGMSRSNRDAMRTVSHEWMHYNIKENRNYHSNETYKEHFCD